MKIRVLSEEEVNAVSKDVDGAYGCSICTLRYVGNHVGMGSSDVFMSVKKQMVQDLIATIRHKESQIGACERMTQRWREQAWDFEHMNKILNEELEKRDATIAEYKSYGDDWRKSHDELFTKYKILFNALERIRNMPGNSSVDLEFLGPEFLRIAREAIAKVGEIE